MNVDAGVTGFGGLGGRGSIVGGTMPEWLARRASLTPDAPALFFGERRWTFAALDAEATAAARRLRAVLDLDSVAAERDGVSADRDGVAVYGGDAAVSGGGGDGSAPELGAAGVEPGVGPRVAVLLPNSDVFVVWVHAVAKAGAVLVPLNARLTPAEMAWQLADSGATVLIHSATYADDAAAVARAAAHWLQPGDKGAGVRLLDVSDAWDDRRASSDVDSSDVESSVAESSHVESSDVESGAVASGDVRSGAAPSDLVSGDVVRARISLDDVHSIVYTSGTTGKPKGAVLTFGNHWWSAVGSVLNLGLVPGDRWLACMPLFHVGGLAILLRSVIYGIPVILHEKFDAPAVNRAIDEQGVSLLSVVAAMLDRMLDARGDLPYPSSLRAVLLGGGPAPEALLKRAAGVRMPVLQTYGLTETSSQVVTLAPEDALRKLGSAGKPLFPVELRIVAHEDDGRLRPAAPGEAGEIAVSGPSVTKGYWRRPDATDKKLRDGWLYTGDVGYVDAEGYLYVLDRRDDMFVSGGENVYPAEVEAVLREHSAVAEAGVVGLPDPRWGRVPAAAVVLREGADVSRDELREFCRERLAGYKVPTRFVFVAELPRNASGKLLRRELYGTFRSAPGSASTKSDSDGRAHGQ